MGGEFKDSQTGFKDAQQKFNVIFKPEFPLKPFKNSIW